MAELFRTVANWAVHRQCMQSEESWMGETAAAKAAGRFSGTGDHALAATTINWLHVVAKYRARAGQLWWRA